MKAIEEKILKDGKIIDNDIIKVDSFLNHQIDINLMREFALGVKEFFNDVKVDKVLTIETSGIAVAYAVSEAFDNVPLLFAKKSKSKTVGEDIYKTIIKSFTRNIESEVTVAKSYLTKGERILIVDDFLAEGNAAIGLMDLCRQAGAVPVGFATVIEKTFQGGRARIEKEGIKVFAGASIKAFVNNKPVFEK